jgi:repressor LexA
MIGFGTAAAVGGRVASSRNGGLTVDNADQVSDLEPIQPEILHVVRALRGELRHPPSMREVVERVRLKSIGALEYQYVNLEAKGYLRRHRGKPRTVEVRLPGEQDFPAEADGPGAVPGETGPEPDRVAWVPVAGRIAAGGPILAQESIEDYLPLPRDMVGRAEGLFILEVVGDSMIGAGIVSGDYVVISPLYEPPRNGDIVAATIDGVELEGTVKTYRKIGRQVWLMPQNPAYTPIPGGRAKFAGKVVAVLRQV